MGSFKCTSTVKQPGCLSRARLCSIHLLHVGVVLDFAYVKYRCTATNPFCAGTRVFVHGGHSNFVLDDLFELDLFSGTWLEVRSRQI